MSTVPEALTAHQCGMSVFAFSLITNECILNETVSDGPTAAEVIESGEKRKTDLRRLVTEMIWEIDREIRTEDSGTAAETMKKLENANRVKKNGVELEE